MSNTDNNNQHFHAFNLVSSSDVENGGENGNDVAYATLRYVTKGVRFTDITQVLSNGSEAHLLSANNPPTSSRELPPLFTSQDNRVDLITL